MATVKTETEFDRRIAAGTTIIVTMEGGIIQDVDGLKPGQNLEVWDFDTDGSDAELETNEAGDEYVLIEYSGGPLPKIQDTPEFKAGRISTREEKAKQEAFMAAWEECLSDDCADFEIVWKAAKEFFQGGA